MKNNQKETPVKNKLFWNHRALPALGLAAALFCSTTLQAQTPAAVAFAEESMEDGSGLSSGKTETEILYVTAKATDLSADQFAREVSIQTRKNVLKERDLWEACSGTYWRSQLSAEERAFYDELRGMLLLVLCGTEDLESYKSEIITPFVYTSKLNRSQVQAIAQLFLYNEPAFFFINNGFVQSSVYDSSGTSFGVAFQCFPAFTRGADRRRVAEQLRDKVNDYLRDADGVSSKQDKAWMVYSRLISEMAYAKSEYDQSIYSALFEHRGVCASYSEAYEMIMNAAGVETLCVTSDGHEWNQVLLDDGNWYAVDLTWSDQAYGADDSYFCVSDETLLLEDLFASRLGSHVPEDFWSQLNRPPCLYDLKEQTAHIHTWDGGVVVVPATASAEGTILYTCTGCGEVMYGTIAKTSSAIGMHRLYFPGTHEHFYTADENEYRTLITTAGWNDESIGWYAPATGNPVYRLFNPFTTDHHYTMDLNEYMTLALQGWQQEGVGWYSDPNETVPVYRQFAPSLVTGTHNYTTDANERAVNAASGAWLDEGIGWYGVNP